MSNNDGPAQVPPSRTLRRIARSYFQAIQILRKQPSTPAAVAMFSSMKHIPPRGLRLGHLLFSDLQRNTTRRQLSWPISPGKRSHDCSSSTTTRMHPRMFLLTCPRGMRESLSSVGILIFTDGSYKTEKVYAQMVTDPVVRSGGSLTAQTNPLWHGEKVKNYLPDMTYPEVESLLSRTDMVILPVTAIEQHGPQLPIGTDYYTGEEQAKLISQKTDPHEKTECILPN